MPIALVHCRNRPASKSPELLFRPADGQVQPVGELPVVLRADRPRIVAVGGHGQRDGHLGVRGRLDVDVPEDIKDRNS